MHISLERSSIFASIGWFAFACSLFLPGMTYMQVPMQGWQIMVYSFAFLTEKPKSLGDIYIVLSGVANLCMVASPIVYFVIKKSRWRFIPHVYSFCATLFASYFFFFWSIGDFPLIAYYFALLGYILITISLYLRLIEHRPTPA